MRFVLGIDPDTKNTGWGIVSQATDSKPRLYAAGVVKIPTQINNVKIVGERAVVLMCKALYTMELPLLDYDAIVVEGQTVYRKGARDKGVDPNALIRIAQVSGAALVAAMANTDGPLNLRLVEPRIWKKQVPKRIHQARVASKLGLGYTSHGTKATGYVVPTFPNKRRHQAAAERCKGLLATHWKHAMDGVGLALWGLENA